LQLCLPFGVPQFDRAAYGRINKEMQPSAGKGGIPALLHVCPTGASLFGKLTDLRRRPRPRLAAACHRHVSARAPRRRTRRITRLTANYLKKSMARRTAAARSCATSRRVVQAGLPTSAPSFAATARIAHDLWFAAPVVLFAGLLASLPVTRRTGDEPHSSEKS
jgi:hypothetical protein